MLHVLSSLLFAKKANTPIRTIFVYIDCANATLHPYFPIIQSIFWSLANGTKPFFAHHVLMTVLEHSPIFLFGMLDLCLPLDDPWASTIPALYSGDEIISDFSPLVFFGVTDIYGIGIIEEKLD